MNCKNKPWKRKPSASTSIVEFDSKIGLLLHKDPCFPTQLIEYRPRSNLLLYQSFRALYFRGQ
jgi:hypothetical protein